LNGAATPRDIGVSSAPPLAGVAGACAVAQAGRQQQTTVSGIGRQRRGAAADS